MTSTHDLNKSSFKGSFQPNHKITYSVFSTYHAVQNVLFLDIHHWHFCSYISTVNGISFVVLKNHKQRVFPKEIPWFGVESNPQWTIYMWDIFYLRRSSQVFELSSLTRGYF